MAARLLKMANSPLYGIAREITSIRQAMLILGTQVLSQMLMQLVVENNVATDPQDRVALATEHQHALAIGHFSALLAGELGHGSPEAFLAGLLHDFGRLVFPAILKSLHLDPNPVARRNVAEVLHGPLGAFMAQSWNLPIVVEEAATRHHDFFFNAVGRPYSQIGHIVACAERLACNYGLDFGEPLAGCCDRNADIGDDPAMVALNMPPSLFSGLLRKADTLAVRLGSDGPISLHAA
jgi:HD-like signal output (HDOD) protein